MAMAPECRRTEANGLNSWLCDELIFELASEVLCEAAEAPNNRDRISFGAVRKKGIQHEHSCFCTCAEHADIGNSLSLWEIQ